MSFSQTCNTTVGAADFLLLAGQRLALLGDFALVVLDAGVQAGNLVLKVLDLEGQFAANLADAVNLAEDGLQLVERFEARLHRGHLFVFVFVCHIGYFKLFSFQFRRNNGRGWYRPLIYKPLIRRICQL